MQILDDSNFIIVGANSQVQFLPLGDRHYLITDVTHSLICEDREKVKGKGEKGRLIFFHCSLKLLIFRCTA